MTDNDQKIEQLPDDIVDNTSDINQIKTNIDDLKKSVITLQQEMEAFDKQKKDLAKEILQQKQKEIEKKKLNIEKKKKETQELINKIRKERIDLKLENLDDLAKKIFEEQRNTEEHLLVVYEKDLKSIEPMKKNFMDKLKEKGNKAWEWTKEHKKPLLIASGIGIAIRGLVKFFKRRKEKAEGVEGKDKKKKKFRNRRYGKALKWGLIGTGAWYLGKGLFSGKFDIFGSRDEHKEGGGESQSPGASPETSQEEFFEKMGDKEKARYNRFADHVNEFFDKNAGILPTELAEDRLGNDKMEIYKGEKMQGLIPFMFNNRYGSVSDILSENSFYYEIISSDFHSILDKMKKWSAKKIYDFLLPMARSFDSSLNATLIGQLTTLSASGKVSDFIKYVEGNDDAQKMITTAFRKGISVVTYLSSRRIRLQYQLVYDYLKEEEPEFDNLSTDEQQELIKDKMEDDEFMQKHIDTEIKDKFDSKKLYDAIVYLEEKECLDDKIDDITAGELEAIDDWKADLIDQDDDGDNIFEQIKERTPDGATLDKESTNELSEVLDGFDKRVNDVGRKSYLNKYLPLLNFFDPEDMITQQILNSGTYDNLVQGFIAKIEALRKKAKAGTLRVSDVTDLQREMDDYVAFEKSLKMSVMYVDRNFDENGNSVLRWFTTVWVSGKSFVSEISMMIDKKDVTGKGLVIAAGAAVSLDIATYPIRLLISRRASSPSLRVAYRIGKASVKLGLRLTGRTLEYSLRNRLPSWIGRYMYKGKDILLKYELVRGNISMEKALKIADFHEFRYNEHVVTTKESLIRWSVGHKHGRDLKDSEVKLLIKYRDNSTMRKQLTESKFVGKWRRIKDWSIYRHKYNFYLEIDNYKKLQSIDLAITKLSGTKAKIFESMMKYTSNLDDAKSLVKMGINSNYIKYFQAGPNQLIEAEEFGKLLGKYGKKFKGKKINEIIRYIAKAQKSGKIINQSIFVRNVVKNFSNIDKMTLSDLNASRYEKVANKVKNGVSNMIDDLNVMLKNPKMKTFRNGIKSKITSLKAYKQTVSAESIKALQDASWLDKITGFGKLTPKGIVQLKNLNGLLYIDQSLVQSLSKATTLDDVKAILKQAGIAVENIDDGVLMKIVKTKNVNKIKSIVNYGAEIDSVKVLKKILQNPAMKVFARWLLVVGVVLDFAFVGMDFASDISEAERIKQYNIARGENKEAEAYFDVIVGGTGAVVGAAGGIILTATTAFGAANAWNPVGRVCLAGAGVAVGVEELGDLYYGEIDKFTQSYKDFLSQSMPEIKQRLININSRQTGLDYTFQDLWSNVTRNLAEEEKKKVSMKTSQDAVKALIYFEELQKYPYANGDLNSPEVRNNPDLKLLVEQQKDLHDKAVKTRYEYIRANYIDGKSSIVSKSDIDNNQGIKALDNILAESRMCQVVENDPSYTNKENVKGYPKYLESELKKSNADAFTKLEKLYATNKVYLHEILIIINALDDGKLPPSYRSLANNIPDEEKRLEIIENIAFFNKYMNYKLLGLSVSDYPTVKIDRDKIDYDDITNALLDWGLTATGFTSIEAASQNIEYIDDNQINEKYNVSNNLGQNILYEIATKLGYVGKNNLSNLKSYLNENKKTTNGIYWDADDEDWAINENNGSDNEFATDAELNSKDAIIKMRDYIYDASKSSTTGNMISGNDFANKEYAQSFVDIINHNLNYRLTPNVSKLKILQYIKDNSNGEYMELHPDLIIEGIKAGIKNVAAFVYKYDSVTDKFSSKTKLSNVTCELLR